MENQNLYMTIFAKEFLLFLNLNYHINIKKVIMSNSCTFSNFIRRKISLFRSKINGKSLNVIFLLNQCQWKIINQLNMTDHQKLDKPSPHLT